MRGEGMYLLPSFLASRALVEALMTSGDWVWVSRIAHFAAQLDPTTVGMAALLCLRKHISKLRVDAMAAPVKLAWWALVDAAALDGGLKLVAGAPETTDLPWLEAVCDFRGDGLTVAGMATVESLHAEDDDD